MLIFSGTKQIHIMKNILKSILLFFFLFTFTGLFGQEGKYTPKLRALYQAEAYDQIKDFKKKKEDDMSSGSLFYKGLAYFMTNNDRMALTYFDKAIDKGPADGFMYYYKATTLYYLKKYDESVMSYDLAIQNSPGESDFYLGKGYALYQLDRLEEAKVAFIKAESMDDNAGGVYSALGGVCFDLEQYDEAISYYKKAMSLNDKRSEAYQGLSFNLGLVYQQSNKYEEAVSLFKEHVFIFPNDYHAYAKLIQAHYALGNYDEAKPSMAYLLGAYNAKKLPSHMKYMYCFDQFKWNDNNILAYTAYENTDREILVWNYKFFLEGEEAESDFKIMGVLDSVALKASAVENFYLVKIQRDTIYRYHFTMDSSTSYDDVKKAVIEILNQSIQPVSKQGDYAAWMKEQKAIKMGDAGTSFETAIVVDNVAQEYQWVRDNYPGLDFQQQSLNSEGNKYYDILNYKDKAGVEYNFYFDITSFFGKF